MNAYLTSAALVTLAVSAVHSILGQRLVFSRMRQGGLVPTNGGSVLRQPHVRIIWASWHALSVLGLGMPGTLVTLAGEPVATALQRSLLQIVMGSMLASSLLVLYGTKARHPGWIGLLAVAVLTWLGSGR